MLLDPEPLQLSVSEQAALPEMARSRIPTVAAAQLAKESWVASLSSIVTGVAHADDGGAAQLRLRAPRTNRPANFRVSSSRAGGERGYSWTVLFV